MKVIFPNGVISEISEAVAPVMIKKGECFALTERPTASSSVKDAEKTAGAEVKALKDPAPYRKQIFNLEGKLADAIKAVPLAETALAESYATEDTERIKRSHAVLNEARDAVPALLAALRQVDLLFYEANAAAILAKHAEARAEAHRAFWKVSPSVRAAGDALIKALFDIGEDLKGHNDVEAEIVVPMLDRVWRACETKAGAKIAKIGYPKRMPTRDDNGKLQGVD